MKKFLKNKITITILIFISVILMYIIFGIYNHNRAYYIPQYPMEDISDILDKDDITEEDYNKIFLNTGVSPEAAKEITDGGNTSILRVLNKMYFEKPSYKKTYIAFPVTASELNKGILTPLVPLKKGDVLITFNTHTLQWRHGHSAIVVDEKGEKILEHMSVGHKSKITLAKRWGIYPGFVILRHKDSKLSSDAADYAVKNLSGIDYSIFAGIDKKDKSKNETVDSSHCSHIVWQAYKAVGCDIDSDGGKIVTPYDISVYEDFRPIQIFGINPEKYIE